MIEFHLKWLRLTTRLFLKRIFFFRISKKKTILTPPLNILSSCSILMENLIKFEILMIRPVSHRLWQVTCQVRPEYSDLIRIRSDHLIEVRSSDVWLDQIIQSLNSNGSDRDHLSGGRTREHKSQIIRESSSRFETDSSDSRVDQQSWQNDDLHPMATNR